MVRQAWRKVNTEQIKKGSLQKILRGALTFYLKNPM